MTVRNSPNGPYVIQANTVNAEVLRQMLESVAGAGVVGLSDLAVIAHSTPNMTVDVAAGFAIVNGSQAASQGSYHVYNDASVSATITPANVSNPRIDLVCLSVQDAQYSGAANQAVIQVVAGTPAGSPVVPATPANSLVLAQVAVAANASTIVSGNVTDRRTFASGGAVDRIANWQHATSGGALTVAELQACAVTIPAMGYPYRIICSACQWLTSSVGTDTVQSGIRDTNIGGALLKKTSGLQGVSLTIPPFKIDMPSGAAKTLVLTAARASGTGNITLYNDDAVSYIDAYVVPL